MVAPNNSTTTTSAATTTSTTTAVFTPPLEMGIAVAAAPASPIPAESREQPSPMQRSGSRQGALPHPPSSTPPPPANEQDLEERVAELEEKLATLSLLLNRRNGGAIVVPHSPPLPPPRIISLDSLPPTNNTAMVPPLESPHPLRRKRLSEHILCESEHDDDKEAVTSIRRTLSQRILASDSDEKDHDTLNDDSTRSIAVPAATPTRHRMTLSQQILHNHDDHNKDSASSNLSATPLLITEGAMVATKGRREALENSNKTLAHSDSGSSLNQPKKSVRAKWMDYLNSYQETTPDVDFQMEEFVRIPSQVEQLLTFGFWICVDSFLYSITILPIRFVWSCLLLLFRMAGPSTSKPEFRFHRRHLYQLIQVSIIYGVYKFVLCPISIGKLYHWIRGQAMLKLYVLIAIVEVFDRLMCSLGQDCLDSMYWNTTRRPKSTRMLISILVVFLYAMAHALILFVHVATLNVAMNSSDQALLTLLISGNFAEIKSTVFKKYHKANLFKIAVSDICERFKLALFLMLVLILNMAQGMDWKSKQNYMYMCGIVWVSELCADWIKHSFITKFNFIPSKVYPEYALLLAGDVTSIGHEGVNLDHSHAVVKRIGLAQIPLVCVMLRLLAEAARYWRIQERLVLLTLAIWIALFGIKIMLGSYLQRVSWAIIEAAPVLKTTATPHLPKSKSRSKKDV